MFVVCILEGEQRKFNQYKMDEITLFYDILQPDDRIAVESTGNTRYFTSKLEGKVKEILVVNPTQFKLISKSVTKTDKKDSELLAYYLQKDMLPTIRQREDLHIRIKSMANTRDKLVKLRTVLLNKIHNLMNANGIISKRNQYSSEKGLDKILETNLDDMAKIEVEILVEQIKHLNEGIKKTEKEINQYGKQLKGFENLVSIKGIGPKSAALLLSIIGNIDDFENEKKLTAYFGLAPRLNQSNDKIHYGRITKTGNKLGRSTLVQCALITKRYSTYFSNFYNRVKGNVGTGKALIATARKLLVLIYNTLKENWIFVDFPNFVLKGI
jgi:transposase